LPEDAGSGRNIGLLDSDGIGGLRGLQGDGIASARSSDRLRIDGSGAVLAHYAVRALIEAHGTADLAGIENGGDLSIWLLIEPETHVGAFSLA